MHLTLADRLVALERNAVHHATKAMVVVDWVVLRTPVVPKRNGVGLPSEAASQFWLDLMAA